MEGEKKELHQNIVFDDTLRNIIKKILKEHELEVPKKEQYNLFFADKQGGRLKNFPVIDIEQKIS